MTQCNKYKNTQIRKDIWSAHLSGCGTGEMNQARQELYPAKPLATKHIKQKLASESIDQFQRSLQTPTVLAAAPCRALENNGSGVGAIKDGTLRLCPRKSDMLVKNSAGRVPSNTARRKNE
ncbi:hypothetical protein EVAR_66426_1 [Eumeta japonica]|uniref:Uncharacterized protein n=1 Tax=Eumeta variegata TaxID=151549 RepID=A0A4C1ZI35_EUMVA|nr:hypothetical protein EVAR_66426_1 [Eumeta japonica]